MFESQHGGWAGWSPTWEGTELVRSRQAPHSHKVSETTARSLHFLLNRMGKSRGCTWWEKSDLYLRVSLSLPRRGGRGTEVEAGRLLKRLRVQVREDSDFNCGS